MPTPRQSQRQQITCFAAGFAVATLALFLLQPFTTAPGSLQKSASNSLVDLWQQQDSGYLGPRTGDKPPARRDDYEYQTNEYQGIYDKSWLAGGYPKQSCWGCRFANDVITRLPFHSVLDAGTGNGGLVRLMRRHGKSAWGIELSDAVLKAECPDLLEKRYVEAGVLTNLPYADNSFDLVFSADVLEHIRDDEADKVISELVRVSRRHLFLSISLKPHTKASAENDAEANRHTMLRPRSWWEAKFKKHGAHVNREMLWAMQEIDSRYPKEQLSDCRQTGSEQDGGLFDVCMVNNTWLVGKREQANVRVDRGITPDNYELEPWFFAFRKKR